MASRVAITPSRSSPSMALMVGPPPSSKSSSSAGRGRRRAVGLAPRPRLGGDAGGGVLGLAGDGRVAERLGHLAAVGLLEVDHLAQQDAAVGELLAPDHDGLEGQGALAQAADHGVAAGLDALGDGDLALAGEQLDRAHLAQVHAHGIVGAVEGALLVGRPRRRRSPRAPRPRSPSAASSSASTTLTPISESMARVSSIASEVTSSDGSTLFSSSMVT